MLQKLYALVHGDIQVDNPDSLMNQEVLLPGHLYLTYTKDKLQEWLNSIKVNLSKTINQPGSTIGLDGKKKKNKFQLNNIHYETI